MTRRLTCDRFYGGVDHRLANLRAFLEYLQVEKPPRNEAVGWLEQHMDATNESTRNRYLSFLRGLDLVDGSGGRLTPGPMGLRYLGTESPETLYATLDAGVAGFDLLLEAFATRGPLSNEECRTVLNNGPYGHDMDGPGVAIRHREWLQSLGYVRQTNAADGSRRYELTSAGYALWNKRENGTLEPVRTDDEGSTRPTSPLQSIPEDPVPDPDHQADWDLQPAAGPGTDQIAATITHQEVVAWLRDTLRTSGYDVRKTRYSDLIAYRDSADQIFLFEVKSITSENVWTQVRAAVGQALEYEYTDVISRDELSGDVQVAICLSQAPPNDVRGYLEHLTVNRDVAVVWPTDDDLGVGGPSSQVIFDALL